MSVGLADDMMALVERPGRITELQGSARMDHMILICSRLFASAHDDRVPSPRNRQL